MTVFDVNLIEDNVHSNVTMDRHVPEWQWTGIANLHLPTHLRPNDQGIAFFYHSRGKTFLSRAVHNFL